ncbi:MAG: epoxyqueuosine reductase [Spirochaetota bacterium]
MQRTPEPIISEICGRHNLQYSQVLGLRPGTAGAEPMQEIYDTWIDSEFHGQMAYLARHAPQKYHPEQLLSGAKSLIQVLMPYYRPRTLQPLPAGWGRIARYAWGRDYHKVLKKRLAAVCRDLAAEFPGEDFRAFVDSGPLDERYYARLARFGGIGRNGLLIHPRFGSWIFLGEILTTLPLAGSRLPGVHTAEQLSQSSQSGAPSLPTDSVPQPGEICPPACTNCRRKCPTGALRADGRFDARLCISYLTIEYPGSIPPELRPLLGDWLFGCDICQDVCPLNRRVPQTDEADFKRDIAGQALDLQQILALRSREEMVARFAGSPLMRASVEQLLRNACIVAAHSRELHLRPAIEQLLSHRDPVVAEQADWSLRNI